MSCRSAGCSFILFLALSASTVQVIPCEIIERLVAALRRHLKHKPVALLAICSMLNLAQDETIAAALAEAGVPEFFSRPRSSTAGRPNKSVGLIERP